MRRLALLLGLTLVLTACGDDDDDGDALCQGYENQGKQEILGADLPSAIEFGTGSVDPDATYEIEVGASPVCLATVTLDGVSVATGFLPDGDPTETIPDVGTFTSLGTLTAGAQSASAPSSIDVDAWVTVSNSTSADPTTVVLAYGPTKIDLVFLNEGGQLSFFTPAAIPSSLTAAGASFSVFNGVTNTASITALSLTAATTDAAEFAAAVAEGTPATSIQVDTVGGGSKVFAVLSSDGKLVQVQVDTIGAPANNATVTFSGWSTGTFN